jgi:hypothetical protein
MRVIKNENLIKRNGRIGQWSSLGALGVLGLGMYLSFQRPDLFTYAVAALILGFLMTQVGMYFSNRWGRSPRPDEQLDAGLKGLPGEATIYHYVTPVPHLLVGPMGVWVLLPYRQRGRLTYQGNRWRLRGGGFMQGYMSIFGQEGLGRPDLDAAGQIEAMKKFLSKNMAEAEIPAINAALVFTNDELEIDGANPTLPALPLRKLKDFIRQKTKEQQATPLAILRIQELLPQAA